MEEWLTSWRNPRVSVSYDNMPVCLCWANFLKSSPAGSMAQWIDEGLTSLVLTEFAMKEVGIERELDTGLLFIHWG